MKVSLLVLSTLFIAGTASAKMYVDNHSPSKSRIALVGDLSEVETGDIIQLGKNCEYAITQVNADQAIAKVENCSSRQDVAIGQPAEIVLVEAESVNATESKSDTGLLTTTQTTSEVLQRKEKSVDVQVGLDFANLDRPADSDLNSFVGYGLDLSYRPTANFAVGLSYSLLTNETVTTVSSDYYFDSFRSTQEISLISLSAKGILPVSDKLNIYLPVSYGVSGKYTYKSDSYSDRFNIDSYSYGIGTEFFVGLRGYINIEYRITDLSHKDESVDMRGYRIGYGTVF